LKLSQLGPFPPNIVERLPDEIDDLLRWRDWVRAYRATAEFFNRKLAASKERQ